MHNLAIMVMDLFTKIKHEKKNTLITVNLSESVIINKRRIYIIDFEK